jgi:hypothetical protein
LGLVVGLPVGLGVACVLVVGILLMLCRRAKGRAFRAREVEFGNAAYRPDATSESGESEDSRQPARDQVAAAAAEFPVPISVRPEDDETLYRTAIEDSQMILSPPKFESTRN